MTFREACARVAEWLHEVPQVTRVLVTHRDGLPLFDELTLADREQAAAATASALGVAGVVAQAMSVGEVQGSIVVGADAVVVMRPLGCGHALAVVAEVSADVGDLHRRVRRAGRELDAAYGALVS